MLSVQLLLLLWEVLEAFVPSISLQEIKVKIPRKTLAMKLKLDFFCLWSFTAR